MFRLYGFKLNVFITYSFGNVIRLDPVFSESYSDLLSMLLRPATRPCAVSQLRGVTERRVENCVRCPLIVIRPMTGTYPFRRGAFFLM